MRDFQPDDRRDFVEAFDALVLRHRDNDFVRAVVDSCRNSGKSRTACLIGIVDVLAEQNGHLLELAMLQPPAPIIIGEKA